ncbi:phosphotransferase enzyme family protein [Clostridium oryzae]|uniref:Phosphotransferase enzyme family protein n=1 Tax=Clostridium oryzae TaxID=1450648 RepID=A0A1V4IDI0_9CLOT|nr:phosphotransferase [Clostridium oryzae]OPJ58058.1 phosphotransferase enzyme family protein [Clostridium oryzae]
MDDLLKEALGNYNIENPKIEFIRHNENKTFRLKNPRSMQEYVLRIHKTSRDFSKDIFGESEQRLDFLNGEMEVLDFIRRDTDLLIQMPIKNRDGKFVTILKDGTFVTVLTWIDGNTIEETKQTEDIAYKVGQMVGKLHNLPKYKIESSNIKRYYYDKKLLLNSIVKIRSILDARIISTEQYIAIEKAISEVIIRISELDAKEKHMSLVHSDLAKSNLIVSGSQIVPIDFSLSGYSYYYMDLGSLFSHFTEANERKDIMAGYRSMNSKTIDLRYIEAFIVFQIILFIVTHTKGAAKMEWFGEAINRWSREFFVPFSEGTPFIRID